MEKDNVMIKDKYCLTIDEAAKYFNIGTKKIRQIAEEQKEQVAIRVGSKVLIKRINFEYFINNIYSI